MWSQTIAALRIVFKVFALYPFRVHFPSLPPSPFKITIQSKKDVSVVVAVPECFFFESNCWFLIQQVPQPREVDIEWEPPNTIEFRCAGGATGRRYRLLLELFGGVDGMVRNCVTKEQHIVTLFFTSYQNASCYLASWLDNREKQGGMYALPLSKLPIYVTATLMTSCWMLCLDRASFWLSQKIQQTQNPGQDCWSRGLHIRWVVHYNFVFFASFCIYWSFFF